MHMPLQSGNTKVLREMKRGYTKEWFLDRALRLRKMCPDVSISTDIIVAFPGESESEFEDIKASLKEHFAGLLNFYQNAADKGLGVITVIA